MLHILNIGEGVGGGEGRGGEVVLFVIVVTRSGI